METPVISSGLLRALVIAEGITSSVMVSSMPESVLPEPLEV